MEFNTIHFLLKNKYKINNCKELRGCYLEWFEIYIFIVYKLQKLILLTKILSKKLILFRNTRQDYYRVFVESNLAQDDASRIGIDLKLQNEVMTL